jgi:uncharacterized membrane protein YfcA
MKLFLKTIFALIVAAFLVQVVLHNRTPVDLHVPPVLKKPLTQPAAMMYFAFFAVGFLTGKVLTGNPKVKSGSSGETTKSSKPKLIK